MGRLVSAPPVKCVQSLRFRDFRVGLCVGEEWLMFVVGCLVGSSEGCFCQALEEGFGDNRNSRSLGGMTTQKGNSLVAGEWFTSHPSR